jgi:hypothetical protein
LKGFGKGRHYLKDICKYHATILCHFYLFDIDMIIDYLSGYNLLCPPTQQSNAVSPITMLPTPHP